MLHESISETKFAIISWALEAYLRIKARLSQTQFFCLTRVENNNDDDDDGDDDDVSWN